MHVEHVTSDTQRKHTRESLAHAQFCADSAIRIDLARSFRLSWNDGSHKYSYRASGDNPFVSEQGSLELYNM